jgi:uncharacterized protein YbcV (DUF1398 family)
MPNLSPIAKIFAQVHSPSGLRFPETVAALLALGVTRYHVDYTSSLVTTYSTTTTTTSKAIMTATSTTTEQISIPNHDLHITTPDARPWDQTGIKTAIKLAQTGESATYADFSQEIIAAGVVGYFAFLAGKRVVYYGQEGDVHVEWFPGAGPAVSKQE